MNDLLNSICKKYKLTFQENMELGHNSDIVCLATNKNGSKVVIKAAKSINSMAEIVRNIEGYRKLKNCGVSFFIPQIIAYEYTDDYAFIIMEYLGLNFLNQTKHSKNSLRLYLALMTSLEKVYLSSLKEGIEGGEAIKVLIQKIMTLYEEYVYENFDPSRNIFSLLKRACLSIDTSSISFYCFSNWDFTPEDVYLTNTGVKYSDPRVDIFGIPIIDMACFGGLIKLYGLPQGNKGYEEFKKFAVNKVGGILHISRDQSEKIFYLGKIFQCFMSIRFRYQSNPKQTELIFKEAKNLLEKMVQVVYT